MPTRHTPNLALAAILAMAALPAQAGLVSVFGGPVWLVAGARSEYLYSPTGLNAVRVDNPAPTYLPPPWDAGFPADGRFDAVASTRLTTVSLADGSAAAKDHADGQVAVQYTVGAGAADDQFQFDFSGSVSNVSSWLTPDKQADTASVQLRGLLHVEISPNSGDRTGFTFGDRVGSLTLQALRAEDAYERFSVTVSRLRATSTVLATQAPGSDGLSVDLYFGERYEVQLDYVMQVPAGIDPPISLRLGGSVSAVPEPAPAALLAAGLLALALRRRGPDRTPAS